MQEPGADVSKVQTAWLEELAAFAPGRHRVLLHDLVGGLARHAGLGQLQHHALREDEAAEALQVLLHALGEFRHHGLDLLCAGRFACAGAVR